MQLCFPQIRPHGVLFDGGLHAKLISLVGVYLRGAYSMKDTHVMKSFPVYKCHAF